MSVWAKTHGKFLLSAVLTIAGASLGMAGFGYIVFPFQQSPLNAAIGGAFVGGASVCYYIVSQLMWPIDKPHEHTKTYRK